MKIAIASGKGGTGKTTLAVALALVADEKVHYVDCDVEAPNGKLFLHPQIDSGSSVAVLVPEVNPSLCNGCGDCGDFCQFNAIASQGTYAMIFPELCHSCGGCYRVCSRAALTPVKHVVGTLTCGHRANIQYSEGLLDIGAVMATPVINAVKATIAPDSLAIIDAPPGSACSMVAAVRDADFVLLVAEPTPFGVNDLAIAIDTLQELQLPFAVVINRYEQPDNCVDIFCRQQNIEVLLRIPQQRKIAEAYSRGESLVSAAPQLKPSLQQLLNAIRSVIREEVAL